MTSIENRKYDMLLRVRAFGDTHTDAFPPSSAAGQAFAALSAAIDQLPDHASSSPAQTREGMMRRNAARAALEESLEAVARCVRVIAADTPGFDQPFARPRLRAHRTIINTGRAIAGAAEQAKDQFVALGLPDTFVSDLRARIDAFEEAVRVWQEHRDAHAAARARMQEGLATALALLPRLDVIVTNHFKDDVSTLVVWERVRTFEHPYRARKGRRAPVPADADAPAPFDDPSRKEVA